MIISVLKILHRYFSFTVRLFVELFDVFNENEDEEGKMKLYAVYHITVKYVCYNREKKVSKAVKLTLFGKFHQAFGLLHLYSARVI